VILKLEPLQTLKYSHFSPLSGLTDKPENYHTVTVELSDVNYILMSRSFKIIIRTNKIANILKRIGA